MARLMREPQQARSRETLERIIAATIMAASTSVDGDFTLREIALAAGISQGTLHTRFPTKDALLIEVHERFWEDRLFRLDRGLAQLLSRAQACPERGIREHMRPWFIEGLSALREDISRSRPLLRVFERAMIDSGRLVARYRHHLREAYRLSRCRAMEVAQAIGFELDGPAFNWTIHLLLSGLREPHPALASLGLELSSPAICDELGRLLCELLPAS